MYLLSFLIFTGLVVNAVIANYILTAEELKKLTASATSICVCSKYSLNKSETCDKKTGLLNNEHNHIDDFCNTYSKTLNEVKVTVSSTTETATSPTTISTPPSKITTVNDKEETIPSATETATSPTIASTPSSEITTVNDKEETVPSATETATSPTNTSTPSSEITTVNDKEETVPSATETATSPTNTSTPSSEITTVNDKEETVPSATETATSPTNTSTPSSEITTALDVACHCVAENSTLPNGPKNCTVIQKSNGIYKPSLETTANFKTVCENIEWESVTPHGDNNTARALSFTICSKDKTECLSGRSWNSVVYSLQALCACANKSLGNVTIPCENKDDWLSLNAGISGRIDSICESLRNLTVKPDEVDQQNSTEPNTVQNTTQGATSDKVNDKLIYPSSSEESETQYPTGMVVGIGFCAFACGTLFAVAAKMSYTRYRRRTYAVHQGRP